MKMYLTLFVYGDEIHYSLSDVRKQVAENEIFFHSIDLEKFDIKNFEEYIKSANTYVNMIIQKHNCKRTYELAKDLDFWYNAITGYMNTKIELGIL